MDLLSIATGAAGVGVVYFLYLCATKGLPVAWAWLVAKWNAGKAGLATVAQDVDAATARIDSLEHSFGLFQGDFSALQAEFYKLKALLPAPGNVAAAAPAAAPQPVPAPAPPQPAPAPGASA